MSPSYSKYKCLFRPFQCCYDIAIKSAKKYAFQKFDLKFNPQRKKEMEAVVGVLQTNEFLSLPIKRVVGSF